MADLDTTNNMQKLVAAMPPAINEKDEQFWTLFSAMFYVVCARECCKPGQWEYWQKRATMILADCEVGGYFITNLALYRRSC
jgi:hypothetical protein